MIALLAAAVIHHAPLNEDHAQVQIAPNQNLIVTNVVDSCRERWENQLVTEAMWSITGKETIPADAPAVLKNLHDSLNTAIPADRKVLATICPPENDIERKGP